MNSNMRWNIIFWRTTKCHPFQQAVLSPTSARCVSPPSLPRYTDIRNWLSTDVNLLPLSCRRLVSTDWPTACVFTRFFSSMWRRSTPATWSAPWSNTTAASWSTWSNTRWVWDASSSICDDVNEIEMLWSGKNSNTPFLVKGVHSKLY